MLTDELRSWFISYVSNQATRALDINDSMGDPDTRKDMISVVQQVNHEMGRDSSEEYAKEILSADDSKNWLHNVAVRARYVPKHQVEGMLKASNLRFACAESGCQFVLGNMPILAGALPNSEQFGSMALPLTSTIIAIFSQQRISTGYCSQESVRKFNLRIVDQSESFCSGSPELTKSLIPKSMFR